MLCWLEEAPVRLMSELLRPIIFTNSIRQLVMYSQLLSSYCFCFLACRHYIRLWFVERCFHQILNSKVKNTICAGDPVRDMFPDSFVTAASLLNTASKTGNLDDYLECLKEVRNLEKHIVHYTTLYEMMDTPVVSFLFFPIVCVKKCVQRCSAPGGSFSTAIVSSFSRKAFLLLPRKQGASSSAACSFTSKKWSNRESPILDYQIIVPCIISINFFSCISSHIMFVVQGWITPSASSRDCGEWSQWRRSRRGDQENIRQRTDRRRLSQAEQVRPISTCWDLRFYLEI